MKLQGADPDFHRRDLWNAIENGDFPEWELGLQVFEEARAATFDFDVLDPTKLIPEEIVLFGKYEIDSGTIISWFFDGKISPLFNFGNDGEGLKRIETLYAFLFALKTETFKAFSVNKQPLDIPKFFEVVIGKFMDADRVALQNALESIRKDVRQSNTLDTFIQTCKADRVNLDARGKLGPRGTAVSMDLGDFQRSAYIGASAGIGNDAHRFYRGDLSENVKSINEGLPSKLTFVHVMIQLLDQHLQASGTDQTARTQTISQIEKHLGTVERLQAEYLTEVMVAATISLEPALNSRSPSKSNIRMQRLLSRHSTSAMFGRRCVPPELETLRLWRKPMPISEPLSGSEIFQIALTIQWLVRYQTMSMFMASSTFYFALDNI